MTGTLLHQGLTLLAYGMGVVFLFLTVLVGATNLMSWLVLRFAGQEALQPEIMPSRNKPQTPDNGIDQQRISVISAAIHYYRARHKKRP